MELTLTRKPKAADAGPFIPTHPRVNLVPQSSLDRAADSKARRLAIVATVGSVVLMGAWWGAGALTAGSAADSLRTKAQQEAVKQACGLTTGSGPLADGQVSANERAAVASIASVAEQAGVPKQYTDPLQAIGDSATGQAATAKAVDALKQACAARGAS